MKNAMQHTHFFLTAFTLLFNVSSGYSQITTASPNQVGDCNTGMFANCDSMGDQAYQESTPNSQTSGNWSDLAGGVASRPFVKRLAIVNGSSETVLLEDGTPSSTLSVTPGSVGVVITPVNLCKTGQAPGQNICYSSPNRISVGLVYRKRSGEVGYNFSFPNDGNLGTTTGSPVSLLSFDGSTPISINSDTVIDLTLALNTLGQSLRWTWLNGNPQFWNTSLLGQQTATIRLKFKLANQPAIAWGLLPTNPGGCSAIPVLTCDIDQSHSDWLSGNLLLSLDDTLDSAMTGALFATEQAIIGSVTFTDGRGTTAPQLQYGLSSSHNDHTGTERAATLRAFLPAATIVQALGIPSFSDTQSSNTLPSDLLGVSRVGSGSSVSNSFERWDESVNGSNGVLMTVSGVTFSAPQYLLRSTDKGLRISNPKLTSGKYQYSLTAKSGVVASQCRTRNCTATVFRTSSNKLSSALQQVAKGRVKKASSGVSVDLSVPRSGLTKRGANLLTIVRSNKGKILSSSRLTLQR